MNIHEYQARQLLVRFGIPVPPGVVAGSADEAAKAYCQLQEQHGASFAVVKAQVHTGGRAKGGGVKLVRSSQEASQVASTMLSKPLVTPQTCSHGVRVTHLLVVAGVDIADEYYVAVTVDRSAASPVLIASAEGGVEIEQVARSNPKAIIRQIVSPVDGLRPYQGRNVAHRLGLHGPHAEAVGKMMIQLCELFLAIDASLVEINPLVVTAPPAAPGKRPTGEFLALDAKINFDDSALYRQDEIRGYHDPGEEDPAELAAQRVGLSYIKLDGNIGCLVNGAGLAMATMDIIKLHGGEPANFLDVGGGASEEAVTEGFRIVLADPKVEGVLVNIFGGIMKCDIIATAIARAAKQVGFKVPLVVRLEGTNVERAREILETAMADIPAMNIATDLTDAAKKIMGAIAAKS